MSITLNNTYSAPNFVFDSYRSYRDFLDAYGDDALNDTIYTINEQPIKFHDFGEIDFDYSNDAYVTSYTLDGDYFDVTTPLCIAKITLSKSVYFLYPVSPDAFMTSETYDRPCYHFCIQFYNNQWHFDAYNNGPTTINDSDIDRLTTQYFGMHDTTSDDIEDKEIEDDWDTIIQNINTGAYRYKYKVGNYKPLDLGSEGIVDMQIAAFNVDDLADDSGKASIAWIAKQALQNTYMMGTDAIGGWEKSAMRTYLSDTIKPLIASNILSTIKTVKKESEMPSNSTQTTVDDIWIPSSAELKSKYRLFSSNRNMMIRYSQNGPPIPYWIRNAHSDTQYLQVEYISNNIIEGTKTASDASWIVICFCT